MLILEDQQEIKELDSQKMYELIKNFPEQMREGMEIVKKSKIPQTKGDKTYSCGWIGWLSHWWGFGALVCRR